MLITLDNVLTPDELATMRKLLEDSSWASGLITAGSQAAQVKNNQQLREDARHLPLLRRMVLDALGRNPVFYTAALPLRILPPFFNRYGDDTNYYGLHTDSAMRSLPDGSGYIRADVSATLFLSEPDEYDGGMLTIVDTFGAHDIKLKAGSMVVYPSSSIHEVSPVTRGQRIACFMFMQSMVRDAEQRRLLFDMDMSLIQLRQNVGETDAVVRLTGTYHNLLRRWAES
ncbi:MAG: Fe2+-dependent dioxygenase [Nitrosomonadales bacterium]